SSCFARHKYLADRFLRLYSQPLSLSLSLLSILKKEPPTAGGAPLLVARFARLKPLNRSVPLRSTSLAAFNAATQPIRPALRAEKTIIHAKKGNKPFPPDLSIPAARSKPTLYRKSQIKAFADLQEENKQSPGEISAKVPFYVNWPNTKKGTLVDNRHDRQENPRRVAKTDLPYRGSKVKRRLGVLKLVQGNYLIYSG